MKWSITILTEARGERFTYPIIYLTRLECISFKYSSTSVIYLCRHLGFHALMGDRRLLCNFLCVLYITMQISQNYAVGSGSIHP